MEGAFFLAKTAVYAGFGVDKCLSVAETDGVFLARIAASTGQTASADIAYEIVDAVARATSLIDHGECMCGLFGLSFEFYSVLVERFKFVGFVSYIVA
jgi:hypothetical protein